MANKHKTRRAGSKELKPPPENTQASPRQTPSTAPTPERRSFRPATIVGWALLATALALSVYVRFRLRDFPLERDEGEFAYAGQLLLEGVPPYKLAYNMKLPGTYMAYAALMSVFGQTTAGVHLGLLAVNIATALLLYRLVREMFDPFSAGMATVVYAILSVSPAFLGMAAHATHFVSFFGLAGAYLLWRHLQSGRLWQAAASGVLMGTAFLMKQQGVFLMVFGGVFLVLHGLLTTAARQRLWAAIKRFSPFAALREFWTSVKWGGVGLYSLSAVLPYGLICLWLWRAGVWEKFWFWTVEYGSKYVAVVQAKDIGTYFWMGASGILAANWPLLLLALAGTVGIAIRRPSMPGARSFAFGFFVFGFLCACPGFYFRQHYFIVMLPAVAMFAGVGCRLLWDLASLRFFTASKPAISGANESNAGRMRSDFGKSDSRPAPALEFGPLQALAALLLMAAIGGTIWMHNRFFFVWSPDDACRQTYMSNPFVEAPDIAKYLQDHTAPDDTIAVIGSEPEIYFDSKRRSATGYIYTYGLMEVQPLAKMMQEEMIFEIEKNKPKYIVFANVRCSWLPQQSSETEILRWADAYLAKNYDPVGIIEPSSRTQSTELWGDRVEQYRKPPPPSAQIKSFEDQRDLIWKLTWVKDNPDTHDFWSKPFITVLRRKES